MSTITGTDGDLILAVCTVSNDGVQIANGESAATAQSIVNDIATIRFTINPAAPVVRAGRSSPFSFVGTWTFDVTGNGVWVDTGTGGDIACFPLDVPHAALLTEVNAMISPVASGRAGVVGAPPHLDIVEIPLATGTPAVQTQADTTATVILYETLHAFPVPLVPTKSNTAWAGGQIVNVGDFRTNGGQLFMCIGSGLTDVSGTGPSTLVAQTREPIGGVVWTFASLTAGAYVVDRRVNRYFVRFVGENGANAVANLKLIGLRYHYTFVRISMDG